MPKSNVIAVDFRPQVRDTSIDELSAELDAIDAALARAHAQARELEAETKPRPRESHWPMRWCRPEPSAATRVGVNLPAGVLERVELVVDELGQRRT